MSTGGTFEPPNTRNAPVSDRESNKDGTAAQPTLRVSGPWPPIGVIASRARHPDTARKKSLAISAISPLCPISRPYLGGAPLLKPMNGNHLFSQTVLICALCDFALM